MLPYLGETAGCEGRADVDLAPNGTMHVLYSLRAEGCPRLALGLLEAERKQTGRVGSVVTLTDEFRDLETEFRKRAAHVSCFQRRRKDFVAVGFRARRLMRALQPCGVICYPLGCHVPIAAAAASLGIPVVVHIGNSPPQNDPVAVWKLRAVLFGGAPFVQRYVACSEFVKRQCCQVYGLPPSIVTTVPNGIRLEAFLPCKSPRDSLRCKNGRLHVGMVATLEGHKDQATLLRAVASIHRRRHPVKLSLVGAGSREALLRRLAAELGIMDLITWTGSVADIPSQLRQFDVFAYSVHGEEGQGIALVEALAAGIPVVASDVGACREVLEDGRWGTLAKPEDPEALADAIIHAADTMPAPGEAVRRFDIQETFWAYQGLLFPHGSERARRP